jgi:D-lyxose ketol-isomerase
MERVAPVCLHNKATIEKLLRREGQAIFIPAGMTHEFWAEAGQYGEVIWTAFGKGA